MAQVSSTSFHGARLGGWVVRSMLAAVPWVALASMVGCTSSDIAQEPSCPTVQSDVCPAEVPSYVANVAPIISERCLGCHGPKNEGGLWELSDQVEVSAWAAAILKDVRNCSQPPRASGVTLTLQERQILEAWLVCGAPNN